MVICGFLLLKGGLQNYGDSKITPTQVSTKKSSQSAGISKITINLLEQNSSAESGTATISDQDGKVIIILEVNGSPTGVEQPAHIHVGKCPAPGVVKYPLSPVLNGRSETTLNVTLEQILEELPLALNIHKSVQESKNYVACGDLKAQ